MNALLMIKITIMAIKESGTVPPPEALIELLEILERAMSKALNEDFEMMCYRILEAHAKRKEGTDEPLDFEQQPDRIKLIWAAAAPPDKVEVHALKENGVH